VGLVPPVKLGTTVRAGGLARPSGVLNVRVYVKFGEVPVLTTLTVTPGGNTACTAFRTWTSVAFNGIAAVRRSSKPSCKRKLPPVGEPVIVIAWVRVVKPASAPLKLAVQFAVPVSISCASLTALLPPSWSVATVATAPRAAVTVSGGRSVLTGFESIIVIT